MPVRWRLLFAQVQTWRRLEGLPLEKSRAKTVKTRFDAICVLAVVCVLATVGFGQDPSNKTANSKPSTAASHAKKAGTKATASSSHQSLSASHGKRASSSTASATHGGKAKRASSRKKRATARGQQKIDHERAEAIQEALIREHYMTGEPTGTWNQSCEDAMRRYQADHGWQSKTVPDSRALISLGLGPSHDHLLNPESAMTTGPNVSRSTPATSAAQSPLSHLAEPGSHVSAGPVPSSDPAPVNSSDHDSPNPQR